MTVKSRVAKLEQAKPVVGRAVGRKFAESLVRAYGDGEPVEVVTDAEFEAAMAEAYGADYTPPPNQQEATR